MKRPRALGLGLALAAFTGCGRDAPGAPDAQALRARAEIHFVESRWPQVLDTLEPLLERKDAAVRDLVAAGAAASQLSRPEQALDFARRALAREPRDPAASYLAGNQHLALLQLEEAEAAFRTVLAADPDDLAARYQLAIALDSLGRPDEALAALHAVRAAGVEADGPIFAAATYRLGTMLISEGRIEEGLALKQEHQLLGANGVKSISDKEIELRGFGGMQPPAREPVAPGPPAPPARWPAFAAAPPIDLPGAERALLADLDQDGRLDLVGWGARGLVVARQQEDGGFTVRRLHERPVLDAAAANLEPGDPPDASNPADPRHASWHPPLELLTLEAAEGAPHMPGGVLRIHALDIATGAWRPTGPAGAPSGDARALLPTDFDHDGLLDVAIAGWQRTGFHRNLGTTREPGFEMPFETAVEARALPGAFRLLADDLDADNDVDYVVTQEGPHDRHLIVLENLRGGRFEIANERWLTEAVPGLDGASKHITLVDLDGDSRPDLVDTEDGLVHGTGRQVVKAPRALFAPNRGEAFGSAQRFSAPLPSPPVRTPVLPVDLDLDGHLDLLHHPRGSAEIAVARGPLTGRSADVPWERLAAAPASTRQLLTGDIEGDLDLDLVLLDGAGRAHVLRNEGPTPNHALLLTIAGRKANAGGIGAIVEVAAGDVYRRIFWDGHPVLVGLGGKRQADLVRVTFTNGVVQGKLDVPAGRLEFVEDMRQGGSCPFLYSWNGERMVFVTDVLGSTPLGLPMAPGLHVPFDHDEWVKLRGDQLAPRDGLLELALTEEMLEVTYLDSARLQAVDHPAGVEVQPNEGFVFPPFPPHELHALAEVVPVARLTDGEGRDLTAQAAAIDDVMARPFRELAWTFKGLSEPWELEIVLAGTPEEREALERAGRLRLLLTGWFQWSDASVNLAAARHPSIAFDPPRLWVPDGAGGWQPAGPPIGFPAGKTKTMVVDVTDVVRRDDPRLRMTSTLSLSWDAIRLALDDGGAPVRRTDVPLRSATLGWRGFSAPLADDSRTLPERFDWNELEEPRWDQHPGRYTRYGAVEPLLGAADDMYVIFGAGDVVDLAFDATALPPLPEGWTRDWLLHLDGWAKDRDPNSSAAERVEPLPFHGMSDYPPPPGEDFPWTDERLAWDREWNTREGARLIPPLSPRR